MEEKKIKEQKKIEQKIINHKTSDNSPTFFASLKMRLCFAAVPLPTVYAGLLHCSIPGVSEERANVVELYHIRMQYLCYRISPYINKQQTYTFGHLNQRRITKRSAFGNGTF